MASIIIYCFIGVLMKFIYCFGNFNNIWILGRYRCICSLPTVVASSFLFPFLSMADGMGREGYRLIVSLVFQLAPEERIVAQTFPFCPELRAGGGQGFGWSPCPPASASGVMEMSAGGVVATEVSHSGLHFFWDIKNISTCLEFRNISKSQYLSLPY